MARSIERNVVFFKRNSIKGERMNFRSKKSLFISVALMLVFQSSVRADDSTDIYALKVRCDSYGYTVGTDAFAACVQSEMRAAEEAKKLQQENSLKLLRQGACMMGNTAYCDNPERR